MKVSDLDVEELKAIIREVVKEEMTEILEDPDRGLEFRPEFVKELEASLEYVKSGGEMVPLTQIVAELGLDAECHIQSY